MPNMIDTLRATLAEKEAELETLTAEIAAFQLVVAYYETHPQEDTMPPHHRSEVVKEVQHIFEEIGRPLHYRTELYPLLIDRGVRVAGQDPARNLGAYLSGDKEGAFIAFGEGRWGLAKWQVKPALTQAINGNSIYTNDDYGNDDVDDLPF